MRSRLGTIVYCPVDTCNAFSVVTPPNDAGLPVLHHIKALHPELIYTRDELERQRLSRRYNRAEMRN